MPPDAVVLDLRERADLRRRGQLKRDFLVVVVVVAVVVVVCEGGALPGVPGCPPGDVPAPPAGRAAAPDVESTSVMVVVVPPGDVFSVPINSFSCDSNEVRRCCCCWPWEKNSPPPPVRLAGWLRGEENDDSTEPWCCGASRSGADPRRIDAEERAPDEDVAVAVVVRLLLVVRKPTLKTAARELAVAMATAAAAQTPQGAQTSPRESQTKSRTLPKLRKARLTGSSLAGGVEMRAGQRVATARNCRATTVPSRTTSATTQLGQVLLSTTPR